MRLDSCVCPAWCYTWVVVQTAEIFSLQACLFKSAGRVSHSRLGTQKIYMYIVHVCTCSSFIPAHLPDPLKQHVLVRVYMCKGSTLLRSTPTGHVRVLPKNQAPFLQFIVYSTVCVTRHHIIMWCHAQLHIHITKPQSALRGTLK